MFLVSSLWKLLHEKHKSDLTSERVGHFLCCFNQLLYRISYTACISLHIFNKTHDDRSHGHQSFRYPYKNTDMEL